MDEYIEIPLETDPSQLVQTAFDQIQARYPDWDPSDPNLEVILLEIVASMAAEATDVAANVARSIFRYFGANLVGVLPQDAEAAVGYSTWTVRDTAGYTIPQGAVVGIPSSDGSDQIPFVVDADVLIPPGSVATGIGAVQLTAAVEGANGSNLTGDPVLAVALDFVTGITLTGPTTGGADAESDDEYLNKLAARLKLQTARPILGRDAAELFRVSFANVFRATFIDNYIPANAPNGGTPAAQTNVEKAVYVVGQDSAGSALDSATKNNGLALLQSMREINFIFNVGDPDYTDIDVTLDGTSWPGSDPAAVETGIVGALQNFLNSATWGSPVATGDSPIWYNSPSVKFNDVLQAARIPGLRNISSLLIGVSGGALGGGDVDMSAGGTKPVPLPRAGTLNVTITGS